MYDAVFYHQSLPSHPLHRSIGPLGDELDGQRMIALAVACLAKCAPQARPVLITGDADVAPAGATVVHRALADPALLQLDRMRAYRDHVAAGLGTAAAGAVFLDTDTLVLRDLAPLFDRPFDMALTYVESAVARPIASSDPWGLPDDGRYSPINFGVMAARFTPAALAFLDAALERFAAIAAAGQDFFSGKRNVFRSEAGFYRIADVRTWGGGQFAITSLLSPALFGGLQERSTVAGADVLLLPSGQWNHTPSGPTAPDGLDGRYILHLKGGRKRWMADFARRYGVDLP